MITLSNITLRRGANLLFENINWTIYRGERIGIIGANGAGKTSLFALLLDQIQSDHGDITIPRGLKFAYVAQETPGFAQSALDFVMDGDEELRHLQALLLQAEEAHDGHKIAEYHEKLAIIDAYTAPSRAARLLAGLSFNHQEQQKMVSDFSGGFRVRLNLARALMSRSDILLLDEPTNHLDLDAVIWLEQWLQQYQGTLLLISHDRDFLDNIVNSIVHLHHKQLTTYTGNYSQFEVERANRLQLQQAQYEKQQKQIAHMQDFVDRFRYKATKARQAQSRLKAIERMDIITKVQAESPFNFEFSKPSQSPYPLLTVERGQIAYDAHIVLDNINLSISPGERITILGPNGAGKSSLIKMLAHEVPLRKGERTAGSGLIIGYFAQHQVDKLQLDASPLDHLRELSETASENQLRTFLGGFDFSGDRVFEPVRHFSGGEKARLALALIVWQRPNLLLLDEPTNHLDLEMRNALSIALQDYTGALILITHDRFLIRSTTDKLLLVADGKLQEFNGDLKDYQQWLFDYRKRGEQETISASKRNTSKKEQRQLKAKGRDEKKPLLDKIKQLEKQMQYMHEQLDKIEKRLNDQSLYETENKMELQNLILDEANIKKELLAIEEAWLQACQKRDENE